MFCVSIDVHIAVAKGGSMTTELFKVYMEKIVRRRTGGIFLPQTLLIMDRAASHKVEEVENIQNTHAVLLPGGCTSLIQPLDVALNKPFKDRMRSQWKRWLDIPAAEQQLTKSGNRQRVSTSRIILHNNSFINQSSS